MKHSRKVTRFCRLVKKYMVLLLVGGVAVTVVFFFTREPISTAHIVEMALSYFGEAAIDVVERE